jgi:hypothetical protein
LLLIAPLAAADDLYTGQGALDADAPDATAALFEALDEVLVRLTGQVDAPMRERLGLGLAQARALVQSQQRVQVPVVDELGEIDQALRLQFEFNADALERSLADAAIPRLGRERPELLLWFAIDDGREIRLASDPALELVLAEQSRRLGLDLLRPIGDALDLGEVGAADIRGGFLDASDNALLRYQADVPVMLDLRQLDETLWEARWFWRIDGLDRSINRRADSPRPLLAEGLEAILAGLAQRYAILPDALGARRQPVVISPIDDEFQYAEALRHLEGLSMVESVRVVAARGRSVDFELMLRSGGFDDALALGGLLVVRERLPDGRLALAFAR